MPRRPSPLRRPSLRRLGAALLAAALALPGCAVAVDAREVVRGERAAFRVATFATGLEHPWGGAFLPDGHLLVTERPGRLRLLDREGRPSPPLGGVPAVVAAGQGGLLDIHLAPDFATTRELYLCLAGQAPDGVLTRLVRARLSDDATALEGVRPLLDATPAQPQGRGHYGCRIAFGTDGKLYLTTGDRQRDKMRAQDPDDLAGKLLRLERDGRPAAGNPFLGRAGVRPEIYALGLRSPQGLARNPATGSLWEVEMGPRGGDEVNLVRPGANYGWPVIGRGVDYDGSRIHEAASRPGMEDPLRWWVPSISPSGAAFYDGDRFPGWKGSLFLAGLNPPNLTRLSTEGDRITGEERVLADPPRLRQVLQGPDGLLYLLTDESQGRILRLEPAD